jgi:hypothetical protein
MALMCGLLVMEHPTSRTHFTLSLSQSACHSLDQRVPFYWPPADFCTLFSIFCQTQASGFFGLVMRIILLDEMTDEVRETWLALDTAAWCR